MKVYPIRWKTCRFAAIFTENITKNNDLQFLDAFQFKYGTLVPKIETTIDGELRETYKKYTVIMPGNIIINGLNLNYDFVTQRVAIANKAGIITSAYIALQINSSQNENYYCYLLKAMDSQKIFNGLGTGIRLTLSYSLLKNYMLPIPPREEQDQIVCYLDWQTSRINRLINAKKHIISLLEEQKQAAIAYVVTRGLDQDVELMDSGIDYIGKVPAHWKVLLNHRIYKEKSRKFDGEETVLSLSQKDGLLPYENMKERSLHTASYENWKLVFPNDLVLNRFKAHLGVFFSSNYRGIVTFHYGVYEPLMKISSKYYEALYHTPEFRRVFASKSNGMTVGLQNLSNTNFYSVYTVYPPYEEQCQIVCKIEEIEGKYRDLIAKINQEIDCLHEYRTRLISDVVTGQIDVRNVEVPDFELVEETVDEAEEAEDEMEVE